MVAEENDPVRRHKVFPVIIDFRGGLAVVVQLKNPPGDKFAVEPVGHRVNAKGGGDEPDRIDRFAPFQSHNPETHGAKRGNDSPDNDGFKRFQKAVPSFGIFS
jgi:hypothetical protein